MFVDSDTGGDVRIDELGSDLKVLDGIASWCGGLHGSMSLAEALSALAAGLGGEAAALARHYLAEPECRTICTFDRKRDDENALARTLCRDVLGHFYETARAGTVWFLSDLTDDTDWTSSPSLARWLAARPMGEIVVIPLDASVRARDFIEFHFRRPLTRSGRHQIEEISRTLVRAWNGRQPGLVTQAQMDDRMVRARAAAAAEKKLKSAPILDMSNPARLSRAEFRVCLLLSRGLSTRGVREELGVCEATVRSHLSSIYSKTEVAGLSELLYRLLSSGPSVAQGIARRS